MQQRQEQQQQLQQEEQLQEQPQEVQPPPRLPHTAVPVEAPLRTRATDLAAVGSESLDALRASSQR